MFSGEPSDADEDTRTEHGASEPVGENIPEIFRANITELPPPTLIIKVTLAIVWAGIAYWLLKKVSLLLLDFWFLSSLGFDGIFWTNIVTGAILFSVSAIAFAAVIYLPIRRYAVSHFLQRFTAHIAAIAGISAGYLMTGNYQKILLALHGESFGTVDPVFGNDIGFYVFVLPALWAILIALDYLVALGLIASLVGRIDQLRSRRGGLWQRDMSLSEHIGRIATPPVQGFLGSLGVLGAIEVFLLRYNVLWKNNVESGIPTGAELIDVGTFFSTVNSRYLTAFVILAITALIGIRLYDLYWRFGAEGSRESARVTISDTGRRLATIGIVVLLVADLAFFVGVGATNEFLVQPNEPDSQDRFLENHMESTLAGYQLDGDNVQTVNWDQPTTETLEKEQVLGSDTFKKAPIVPGWTSYLDAPVDLQHIERMRKTGSSLVYGPLLQTYRQEQQLQPYYDFSRFSTVRYTIDGEKQIFATASRELPVNKFVAIGDQPLQWASIRFQYTRGYGLVMSPAAEVTSEGRVKYAVKDIPPVSQYSELESQPQIYYGAANKGGVGAALNYIFTHGSGIPPLTESGEESFEPPDAGVPMDSFFKRATFTVATSRFGSVEWNFLTSQLIDHEKTRIHYYRKPTHRLSQIAPFLFVDCNSYAVAADGRTNWMVNGLTTTDRYPNSERRVLGDKAEDRCAGIGQERGEQRRINYAEDSVKATVDATTGEVTVYKWQSGPVVDTWQNIYPGLFTPREKMPPSAESHVQYPIQWAHIQFDDIYKRYHQRDLVEFYNNENPWDDADEVRGALVGNREQVVFSTEPMDMLVDPSDFPAESGVAGNSSSFMKAMVFTPENTANLRSVMVVSQDPENYGQIINLRIPQGKRVYGPEQADSLVEQNPDVTTTLNLWKRQGGEVIRGHTIPVFVDGNIVYLEPIWIESQQNRIPEIKLFTVVHDGQIGIGDSPEAAVNDLYNRTETAGNAPATGGEENG